MNVFGHVFMVLVARFSELFSTRDERPLNASDIAQIKTLNLRRGKNATGTLLLHERVC